MRKPKARRAKGRVPSIGGDVGAYIRRRMAADPRLAAGVMKEFNKLQLARQVKALREARNLSQAELAARVGTKQPAIARIESGHGVPRLDFLHKVAVALGGRLDVKLVAHHRVG
jgi:ribosome-binding protein aMBF1 (putative translation factor)